MIMSLHNTLNKNIIRSRNYQASGILGFWYSIQYYLCNHASLYFPWAAQITLPTIAKLGDITELSLPHTIFCNSGFERTFFFHGNNINWASLHVFTGRKNKQTNKKGKYELTYDCLYKWNNQSVLVLASRQLVHSLSSKQTLL